MKTIPEIIAELKDRFGLDYSASIFRADRRASYGIEEPVYRSCPQRFADDTAERIARRLGWRPVEASAAAVTLPVSSALVTPQLVGRVSQKHLRTELTRQIVSMKGLRKLKGKGQR